MVQTIVHDIVCGNRQSGFQILGIMFSTFDRGR